MATAALGWLIRMVNRFTAKLPLEITWQYLVRGFRALRLRGLVASQWADYGIPPGRSAFATHTVVATHYFGGARYPEGGNRQSSGRYHPAA
jgi:all-trans-retinol 13,14-reductase